MQYDQRNESGRNATALLASVFVIVGGLLTCVMIALVFADRPSIPLAACGVYLATMSLLFWAGRERPRPHGAAQGVLQFISRGRRNDRPPSYKPRRRATYRGDLVGTNEPPSVESVREICDNARTWVPSDRNLPR